MCAESCFRNRTISVVGDLSTDEQIYLYEKTRRLKEAIRTGDGLDAFRIDREELGIYLVFLEDSTRTKESFRNAAKFHRVKLNDFHAQSSSITTKKESITDTVKMLFGYGDCSVFVVRSKLEGVCRWLETALGAYAASLGRKPPAFINAGDGKHEHPTQEYLDQFTFLERLGWKRDSIHLALVGDLHHGRTVHTKAEGLRIFGDVRVDLIAPAELAMPDFYRQKMAEHGFAVRTFPSIEAYLDGRDVAPIWYFTRLQLERMGEAVLEKADYLRRTVTFRPEFRAGVPRGVRFYHPLPRHREHPTIPSFLDETPMNGWDGQSINGYYTRIVELALVAGTLGEDFRGEPRRAAEFPDDFVEEAPTRTAHKPEYKVGIKPVDNGIVIDHIGKGRKIERIWDQIVKVRRIMGLNCRSSHGVYHSGGPNVYKGIISLPDVLSFDQRQIKMLGAIAPGCTLNIIKNARIVHKYRLLMPPRVYSFDEISCKNDACVSHPSHHQHVRPEFLRRGSSTFVCKYCDRPHAFEEIWDV